MQRFQAALPTIIRQCARAEGLLLLFDFDGTLSAIVERPSQARMLRGWGERLARLNRQRDIVVGIVTGRALDDIRRRARVSGIIYAASHGFEITRGTTKIFSGGREHHRPLACLARQFEHTLKDIRGVQIEYKQSAVAVHYRRVEPCQRAEVRRRVKAIARPFLRPRGWMITKGKMVMEVRPAGQWNKGSAVAWIIKQVAPRFIPCYIGDDVTDEDAFRVIGRGGITVRIGKRENSRAQYFVQHIDELIPWLEEMALL